MSRRPGFTLTPDHRAKIAEGQRRAWRVRTSAGLVVARLSQAHRDAIGAGVRRAWRERRRTTAA